MTFTIEPFVNDGALRLVLDLATINDYTGRTPEPAELAAYVPTTKFSVFAVAGAVRLAADSDATLTDKVTRTLTGLRVGTRYDVIFQVRGSGVAQVWKAVAGGVTRTFTPPTSATPGSYIVTFTATTTTHDLVFSLNALPTGATSLLLSWLKVTPDNTTLSLTRSDFNGTKPVRPPAGGFDMAGGRFAYADTEHALTGNVAYTALVQHPGGSTQIETVNLNVTGLWSTSFIAPPLLPRLGTSVEIVETYEATSATSSVTHNVIGRSDPLVAIGFQRLRAGTMKLWAKDYAHAQAIVKTAGRGQVLQWRQPDYPGLDMYFTTGDVSVQPYDERTGTRRWFVLTPYTEVLSPASNQLGTAVWNMERSSNRNATFFDSLNEFPTFLNLMIGPGNDPL
ncbi:hypothetical protein ACFWGN_20695 [Oerskovia sp. NPDC060338]|uniref:hypothetical protein n=1 Tax=Oerskovia sp. NPDC060338 TaxID=3347100 RepID=UPI00364DCEE3